MNINGLPILILVELIISFVVWWLAIYLFVQNPSDRKIQLLSLIFATISFYMVSDSLFTVSFRLQQNFLSILILKSSSWTIYLPSVLLYHLSHLLKKKEGFFSTYQLGLVYFFTGVMVYLEIGTNWIHNYSALLLPTFNGDLVAISGTHIWLMGIFLIVVFTLTGLNFLRFSNSESKYSDEWWKYFLPVVAMTLNIIVTPVILLSYYGVISHSVILPAAAFLTMVLLFALAVLKYRLFIEDPKLIFGKNTLYSFVVTATITIIIGALIFSKITISSVSDLILAILSLYLVIAALPSYSWVMTFINDFSFNPSLGLSVVNDIEVLQAIKNYYRPEQLEDNALLRLQIVKSNHKKTPIDALKIIIEQAIKYFKPKDASRRTKQNLKYQILKMIAFDQAEEGQILWELGFEDYPVRIMSNERKERPPKFRAESPADYSYISRNAYLVLKKEAIHNVTWRISYLEKQLRK